METRPFAVRWPRRRWSASSNKSSLGGATLDRRSFLRRGLLCGAGALLAPDLLRGRRAFAAAEPPPVSRRAIDLVGESLVVDLLGLVTLDWARQTAWHRDPACFGDDDFARLRATGIRILHPAVDPNAADPEAAARRWMLGWRRLVAAHPDRFLLVTEAADLDLGRLGDRIGLIPGLQSSGHLRTPEDVFRFHRLGQRISQLTYDGPGALGTGCRTFPDHGLTALGAEVVAAMNEVGMAVDVSHCGDRTALDAVAASRRPVLITHANCRALVPGHPRCKPDEVIRAVAAGGGVVGIAGVRAWIAPSGEPTLAGLLDHYEHVARLVGPEHVALGSDTDADAVDPRTGAPRPAYRIAGLAVPLRAFQIAEGLLARGWRRDDVALALGGNARRVLREIWGGGPAAG